MSKNKTGFLDFDDCFRGYAVVLQNARLEGFNWNPSEKYGNLVNKAGPYYIKVFAKAMTKTTKTFGEHQKITYENYYKGESHHGNENPSQKLNSWAKMGISDREEAQEIPYTDENALFFNDLIWGIVKLAKLIQDHTFKKHDLLETIASNQKLLN